MPTRTTLTLTKKRPGYTLQHGTMNYEGQLFAQQQQSIYKAERHVNPPKTSLAPPVHPLRPAETMQKVQAHDDQSSASGSGVADLHSLDNETDTFGRQIMQHERDSRRLQSATRNDQQPILRNRARPRISELVARREREEALATEQRRVRTGSTGSGDSNPPLNVPRDWGVRARSHRGWMSKIREPSEADINSVKGNVDSHFSGMEEDAVVRHRSFDTRDDFWSKEDERLPSMEHTPPSMRRPRPAANTGSLNEINSTLRHIIDSEDQDFGELSLLASTPAAIKPERGHTRANNSEDELVGRQKSGRYRRDLLSNRSPNRESRQARTHDHRNAAIPQATTLSYEETRATRKSGLVGNKENEPFNDADNDYTKGRRTTTIPDRTTRAVTFRQRQRPDAARNNSLHLLQRLATSLSPSPGKSSSEAELRKTDGAGREAINPEIQPETAPTSDGEPIPPVVRTARRRITSTRQEEDRPNPKPERALSEENENELIPSEERSKPAKETLEYESHRRADVPGPSIDTRPLLRSSDAALIRALGKSSGEAKPIFDDAQSEPLGKEKSNVSNNSQRGRSALEDIVREARRDPNAPFGDATLQSLEDIAHPNVDPTDTSLTFDTAIAQAENLDEVLDIGRPLTQAEKDRRQEDLAIESMNKHLRAARTSIKDAGRGLRRVENKWESSSPKKAPRPALADNGPKEDADLRQNSRTVCSRCDGSPQSVWKRLWTEFRSNFYVYDSTARLGIRMTWLGMLTTISIMWYLVENLLCYQYCHPLYAEWMVGYGVDPDAPRYPFVIPTLFFRPFRPIWKPIVEWLHASFMTVFYMVFEKPPPPRVPRYMQPGFEMTEDMINWHALVPRKKSSQTWDSAWTSNAATAAAAVAGRVSRSFVDAVDGIGHMNDDEYL
ncbi:hypothetical protein Q7P37_003493 [Cladosporium fusiforme]